MKKILTTALAMLVAITFVGCKGEVDYVYTSYYTYTNNSSREIVVAAYVLTDEGNYEEYPEFSFRIPIKNSHALRFDAEGGFPYPFMWRSPNSEDSLSISNGLKQFGYIRHITTAYMGKLFIEDSYQIIKPDKKKRRRTYQYIFTDEDFENATPIE